MTTNLEPSTILKNKNIQSTCSPVDQSIYVEREYATSNEINETLQQAAAAKKYLSDLSISQRATMCKKAMQYFENNKSAMAKELTMQMGRPIAQTPGEIDGCIFRANKMIDLAESALSPIVLSSGAVNGDDAAAQRFICRQALGVVFVIAPWNYPYLTAVNTIIPAIMSGNTVVLKHSAQTPLCAERFFAAFEYAGFAPGVFQYLHLQHEQTAAIIADDAVDFVAFTGSVAGGNAVVQAAANRFIGVGLELGGKDPAYVRADADLTIAIDSCVDGAFFNAGQSCCGVERIYVNKNVYANFIEQYCAKVKELKLGNPLSEKTTLGPMVRPSAVAHVKNQIKLAEQAGAKLCIDQTKYSYAEDGTAYCAPQVLINVDHSMEVMTEESFGPVVGIMSVENDQHAIQLMNDSKFGLTASVWTQDIKTGMQLGERVETGTWFVNRCDYLDPELAWVGVKQSGRGCTLSRVGYEQLTRAKSFYARI